MSNAILSLLPVYAEAIINGTKTIEFRRKIFSRDIQKIYIYSSAPAKMILGYFTIKEFIADTPENLWERFSTIGGIEKKAFFEYFNETEKGFGIVIKEVIEFEKPIDPIDFIKDFHERGTYIYLD